MSKESENINIKQMAVPFAPFEYHQRLKEHLKKRKKTWDWFKEKDIKVKQIENYKTNLLKNSYRLERAAHEDLYVLVDQVVEALAINANVTLYQEYNSIQLNASISVINQEAHIVFSSNIISLLSDEEMKALLAHELSHFLFYKIDNEDFEVTNRIILALANDAYSENAIIETGRVYQLYMELFCDYGALKACGDYKSVIRMLVKLETALQDVNADSYLNQAQEILKSDSNATSNDTHPESYIRSLALYYLSEKPQDYLDKISQLIEGNLDLNRLDIFQQKKLNSYTQVILNLIIKPHWINTSTILNLCKQYYSDFYKEKDIDSDELVEEVVKSNVSIKNYFAYVLLDFAKIDTELEGLPMAHTLEIATLLGASKEYEKVIRKELKLTVRDFKILKEKAMIELQNVKESKDESIYND